MFDDQALPELMTAGERVKLAFRHFYEVVEGIQLADQFSDLALALVFSQSCRSASRNWMPERNDFLEYVKILVAKNLERAKENAPKKTGGFVWSDQHNCFQLPSEAVLDVIHDAADDGGADQ